MTKQEKQKRMKKIVAKFQEYVKSYTNQSHYLNYSDEIFIDDMLYGIAISINEKKYQFADGYKLWKKELDQYFNKGILND